MENFAIFGKKLLVYGVLDCQGPGFSPVGNFKDGKQSWSDKFVKGAGGGLNPKIFFIGHLSSFHV